MGVARRWVGWLLCLAGLCGANGQATAQPELPLQLFSAVDQTVAAVGETFILEVEAYATPRSERARHRLVRAFAQARLAPSAGPLEVVRVDTVCVTAAAENAAAPVLALSRRFVLRSWQVGTVTVPAWELSFGGRTYATYPHRVEIFEVDPRFFKASRAIFPVVAESVDPATGRPYLRIGSAFLADDDAVVTSLHVVVDAHRVKLALPEGKQITLKKAWTLDPVRDVAVLYVDPERMRQAGLQPLRLAPVAHTVAPWKQVSEAHVVFTHGWPGGVRASTAGASYEGATLEPNEAFWVSANPVRPGDSGGPLMDNQGRVLGVVAAGSRPAPNSDVLREKVCMATDPRPALLRKQVVKRPRSLKALFHDEAFARQPHVQALRLSAVFASGPVPSWVAEQLGQFDAALAAEAADDAGLLFLRGSFRQMLGIGEDAAADFQAALDRYEGYFPAAYMLAVHHLRGKAYAEAERFFAYTQGYQPYAHLATYGLARAKMGRLRYGEAVPHLRAVLRYDPGFAPALFDLALCYFALGDEARLQQLWVCLEHRNPAWAGKLERVLRSPALQPTHLAAWPMVALPRGDVL